LEGDGDKEIDSNYSTIFIFRWVVSTFLKRGFPVSLTGCVGILAGARDVPGGGRQGTSRSTLCSGSASSSVLRGAVEILAAVGGSRKVVSGMVP